MAELPPVVLRRLAGVIAAAPQSAASAEVARSVIAASLRRRGPKPGAIEQLIKMHEVTEHRPAVGIRPDTRVVTGAAPAFRAAWFLKAAERVREAERSGQDVSAALAREERYLAQHVAAQAHREQSAALLDAARDAYGRTLGWYAEHDERTTPECRAADGMNFDPAHPPVVGLPGIGPHHGCRCRPGPPHPGGSFMPAAVATDPRAPVGTTEPEPVPVTLARGGQRKGDELEPGDPRPASKGKALEARRGKIHHHMKLGHAGKQAATRIRRMHPDWPEDRVVAVAAVAERAAAVKTRSAKGKMARPRGSAASAPPSGGGRGHFVKSTAEPVLTEVQLAAIAEEALTIELSAKTPAYSVTPSPHGRPGGPGLWGHKGWHLPAYIQNVARGIKRQGHTTSRAIEIAIGKIRDWARGGGDVSPEVRAAAAKAIAQWMALRARAKVTKGSGRGGRGRNTTAEPTAAVELGHLASSGDGPQITRTALAKMSPEKRRKVLREVVKRARRKAREAESGRC